MKVTVTTQSIENGYEWDIGQARKFLNVGSLYTVKTEFEHDLRGKEVVSLVELLQAS
jgi:hypothetical protein